MPDPEFFPLRVAPNTHFNGYLLTHLVSIVKQPEGRQRSGVALLMDLKTLVMTAFQVSLLLTVFSFGLSARLRDLLFLFRRPGLLLRSLLTMFVIMPVAALLLVRLFEAPRTVEIVLVALAISPIPPLLPRKFRKIGATTGYGLGLLTAASLLSIVIVPVMTQLLGRYFLPFTMSPSAVASMIMQAVIAPIVGGLIVRRFLPEVANRLERPIGVIAGLALTAAVLVLVAGSIPTLLGLMRGGTLLVMVTFVLTGLAVGYLMGAPNREHQGALALASASRHPGIALALASASYPDEQFGGIVLLFLVVNALVSVPFMKEMSAGRPSQIRMTA